MKNKSKSTLKTVWMNVSTSANWNRPPVGIVRVEQALCLELSKLLGERFKTCIWMDDKFVQWVPPDKQTMASEIEDAVEMLLPRTPSFDLSRRLLKRVFEGFVKNTKIDGNADGVSALELSIPIGGESSMEPVAGDVLISVGLDWDHPYTSAFYTLARKKGIRIVTCCYDLIPVIYPQYCVGDVADRFKDYFNTITWGSDAVLCISKQTQKDLLNLWQEMGSPIRRTQVIPLGDNVPAGVGTVSETIEVLSAERYILFVSTIERRKNHEVLYRAYHLLAQAGRAKQLPKLVFVGMPGWGVGDLLKDIELDPITKGLIVQLNHVTDAELLVLYKNAFFCAYPSLYEGWGLPVGEALSLGKAVLSSDRGSLPEVGRDLVRYVPAWDPHSWADAIWEWVDAPSKVYQIEGRIKSEYSPKEWKNTAQVVVDVIEEVISSSPKSLDLYPGYDFSTQTGLHIGPNLQGTNQFGFIMHGPYISMPAGDYVFEIYDDAQCRPRDGVLNFDVVCDGYLTPLFVRTIDLSADNFRGFHSGPLFSFDLHLDRSVDGFEIRCVGGVEVRLNLVRIISKNRLF